MEKTNYSGLVAYVGDVASQYDADRITEEMWGLENAWLANTLGGLDPKSSVLDLPVGTGRFMELYQKLCFDNVIGIDASVDMLSMAEKKKEKYNHNIELMTGRSDAINFPDNTIDYILCFRLFHLLPNDVKRKTLNEFARVVKKSVFLHVYTNILVPDEPAVNGSNSVPVFSFAKKVKAKVAFLLQNLKIKLQSENLKVEETPWVHIDNYPCGMHELNMMITEAGFFIKEVEIIGAETRSPAKIFRLETFQ